MTVGRKLGKTHKYVEPKQHVLKQPMDQRTNKFKQRDSSRWLVDLGMIKRLRRVEVNLSAIEAHGRSLTFFLESRADFSSIPLFWFTERKSDV